MCGYFCFCMCSALPVRPATAALSCRRVEQARLAVGARLLSLPGQLVAPSNGKIRSMCISKYTQQHKVCPGRTASEIAISSATPKGRKDAASS